MTPNPIFTDVETALRELRAGLAFHRELSILASLEDQRRYQREIGIGAQILLDLNLRRVRLLTNHPRRVLGLEGYGIEIAHQLPITAGAGASCEQDWPGYRVEEALT